jgi:hypothetical protein
MSNLLIVNGLSYDVKNSKLQYAIDTQFNYYKFPPRIKSISTNDSLDLTDTLNDIETISGTYGPAEDTGMQMDPSLATKVLRAGLYDAENQNEFEQNPNGHPQGYNLFKGAFNKLPHGGWVIPTKLDMSNAIDGTNFAKKDTFIVTPEMIEAGENIYFNIQVALRVSSIVGWVTQKLADPEYESIPEGSINYADPAGNVIVGEMLYGSYKTPGYKALDAVSSISAVLASFVVKSKPADWWDYLSTGNTALIELALRRQTDKPTDSNPIAGCLNGTFHPAALTSTNGGQSQLFVSGWDPVTKSYPVIPANETIGETTELLIDLMFENISKLDIIYKEQLTTYNNMLSQINERSTKSDRNRLDILLIESNKSKAILDSAVNQLILAQTSLKKKRLDFLKTRPNILWQLPAKGIFPEQENQQAFPVNCLQPVYGNRNEMIYNMKYVVDIKTAKPFDEYYITTCAGTPDNLIYKDETFWKIVPQSKLSSIIK